MRRGFRTYTTVRAAVTAFALLAAAIGLSVLGAVPALTLALLTVTAAPAALMIAGLTAGFLPTAFCLAGWLAAIGCFGPPLLLGCAALYLLPVMAVYAVCLLREVPFWKSCGALAAAMTLSLCAIYLLLQGMTGGALYQTAGSLAAQAVNDWPYRDELLYLLASNGFLQVPAAMRDSALVPVTGGYTLSPELINELLLQIRGTVQALLSSLTPGLLISGSGLSALMGLSLGIRWGRQAAQRRAFRRDEPELPIPDLGMPPLREWHLPRPWGLRIAVLGLGYFLYNAGGEGPLNMLGALMFQAFSLCFGVQGVAAMNHSQHKRGTGRFWRAAIVVLAIAFRFMQIALIIVGVIDQITNARGLRPPMRPRGEEEE